MNKIILSTVVLGLIGMANNAEGSKAGRSEALQNMHKKEELVF